jgi:hypothetical protein
MNPSQIRILIAVLMIAHALVHVSLTFVPVPKPGAQRTPYWPSWWRANTDPDWLASKIGLGSGTVRTIGWLLWVGLLVGFILAGLGLLGVPLLSTVWQPLAIVGSLLSLVLLVFYWHPWLVVGVALNAAFLAAIWQQWPAAVFSLN